MRHLRERNTKPTSLKKLLIIKKNDDNDEKKKTAIFLGIKSQSLCWVLEHVLKEKILSS